MKRREYHIGPGAASLLLVIVAVSLSVLALLALIDARSDHKLTERSIQFATSQYVSAASAERKLAELDAVLASCAEKSQDHESFLAAVMEKLPAGMEMHGDTVSWEEPTASGGTLACTVAIREPGSMPRYVWQEHMFIGEINEDQFE